MGKLYILLDEWNYNRVFIEKELSILRKEYDITIICNDVPKETIKDIKYITYKRQGSSKVYAKALFKFIIDKDAWHEIALVLKTKANINNKIPEVVRFYINAELFYNFLCKNSLIKKDEDAIYYTYWYFWKCFALTKNRKKYSDIKIISRIHGYDLYNEQLPSNFQPFKKAMEKKLDKLVFISDQGMDYYRRNFSGGIIDENRCILSYLGTDNDYELKEYTKKAVFTIVSCSSLIKLKAVNRIINALSLINTTKVHWVHFGGGELEDELRQQAKELLDSKDNITYELKGYTPNSKVLEYYASEQVDAFITTSTNEGMPMSIMEALSFGIPVIASAVGNIPNMINGNGILLTDNYSDTDVSTAISNMANMPASEYLNMRKIARTSWEEKYVARKNFADFVENVVNKL